MYMENHSFTFNWLNFLFHFTQPYLKKLSPVTISTSETNNKMSCYVFIYMPSFKRFKNCTLLNERILNPKDEERQMKRWYWSSFDLWCSMLRNSLLLLNSSVITELTKIYHKSLWNNHFWTPYIRNILSKMLLKVTSSFLKVSCFVKRSHNFAY